MASVSRHGRWREPGGERRYVASLLWRGPPPRPANDNCRGAFGLPRLLSLAASALLLAAAVCAVVS